MITDQSCTMGRQLSEVDVWLSKQSIDPCKMWLEKQLPSVRLILDKSTWCTVETPEEVVVAVALAVMDVSIPIMFSYHIFCLISNAIYNDLGAKFYSTLTLNKNELHICYFILKRVELRGRKSKIFSGASDPTNVTQFIPSSFQCVSTTIKTERKSSGQGNQCHYYYPNHHILSVKKC